MLWWSQFRYVIMHIPDILVNLVYVAEYDIIDRISWITNTYYLTVFIVAVDIWELGCFYSLENKIVLNMLVFCLVDLIFILLSIFCSLSFSVSSDFFSLYSLNLTFWFSILSIPVVSHFSLHFLVFRLLLLFSSLCLLLFLSSY